MSEYIQFELYRLAYKRAEDYGPITPEQLEQMSPEELRKLINKLLSSRKTRRGGLGPDSPKTTCPVTGEPREYPNWRV